MFRGVNLFHALRVPPPQGLSLRIKRVVTLSGSHRDLGKGYLHVYFPELSRATGFLWYVPQNILRSNFASDVGDGAEDGAGEGRGITARADFQRVVAFIGRRG